MIWLALFWWVFRSAAIIGAALLATYDPRWWILYFTLLFLWVLEATAPKWVKTKFGGWMTRLFLALADALDRWVLTPVVNLATRAGGR